MLLFEIDFAEVDNFSNKLSSPYMWNKIVKIVIVHFAQQLYDKLWEITHLSKHNRSKERNNKTPHICAS